MKKVLLPMSIFISAAALWGQSADIPSEVACPAKCQLAEPLVRDAAKNIINDDYFDAEDELRTFKDEHLDEFSEWLNDQEVSDASIQEDVMEIKDDFRDEIDKVDVQKVANDSKTIASEAYDWFEKIDMSKLRQDADNEANFFRNYINDLKATKDELLDGDLYRNIEDAIASGSEELIKTDEKTTADVKSDKRKKKSRAKDALARFSSLGKELEEKADNIRNESESRWKDLRETYRENADEWKVKKQEWEDLIDQWRSDDDVDDGTEGAALRAPQGANEAK